MLEKVKNLLLTNSTARQTVAKNAFWLGVSNIIGRLLRAIIIIYGARVLGAADWGVFSYAITFVAMFTILTDLGTDSILTRELAKAKDAVSRQHIFSAIFFLKIFLAALGIFLTFILLPYIAPTAQARTVFLLAAFILVFDNLRNFSLSFARSLEKMEWEAGMFILTNAAIVVFGFIFLGISSSVISYTQAYVAGTAFGAIASFALLWKYFRTMLGRFPFRMVFPILRDALPIAFAGILGGIMVNTDVIVVGLTRTPEEVGFYSAAQRIILLLYILPGIIATSILPPLSRLAQKNDPRARLIVEFSLSAAILVGLPMTIGGFIFGKSLIGFLFGHSYLPAALAFQILSLTIVINFINIVLSNMLFAFNRQRALITYSLIGAALNVGLDLLFVPYWGIAGVAAATLLVQIITGTYLWRKMKKTIPFLVKKQLMRILGATAVMGGAAVIASIGAVPVLLAIAASAITYFGMLYALKEPLFEEARSMFAGKTAAP